MYICLYIDHRKHGPLGLHKTELEITVEVY